MKTLKDYITEGLLDADFADKDISRLDLIESAFHGFHASGMGTAFAEFMVYVLEIECAKIYSKLIQDTLDPVIRDLEKNKKYPVCGYILRELNGVSTKITNRFGHDRTDIPDYVERVMAMVRVAHELDDLLDKHNKKYKNGTMNEICARLNIRGKRVVFEISTSILDSIDKNMDIIKKSKFSGKLIDTRKVHDKINNEELSVIIQIP